MILRECAQAGVESVRVSFATIYSKVERRGVQWVDPPLSEKLALASGLVAEAAALGLVVDSCSQPLLSEAGARLRGCVDGALLSELHPRGLPAPLGKDKGQRRDCFCTPSVDVGSYGMSCPNGCLYCYANPRLDGPGREAAGSS